MVKGKLDQPFSKSRCRTVVILVHGRGHLQHGLPSGIQSHHRTRGDSHKNLPHLTSERASWSIKCMPQTTSTERPGAVRALTPSTCYFFMCLRRSLHLLFIPFSFCVLAPVGLWAPKIRISTTKQRVPFQTRCWLCLPSFRSHVHCFPLFFWQMFFR